MHLECEATITMNHALTSYWHLVIQAQQGGFDQYAASVGMARFDHPFWGRPEEMTMKRPVYLVDSGKPSSDLLGGAAAGKQQCYHVLLKLSCRRLATERMAAQELSATLTAPFFVLSNVASKTLIHGCRHNSFV